MGLNDRLDFEEGKISSFQLLTKNCFNCKYWLYKVSNRADFCHKCVNNPKVNIKLNTEGGGYSLETLFDYYTPCSNKNDYLCSHEKSVKDSAYPFKKKLLQDYNVQENKKIV